MQSYKELLQHSCFSSLAIVFILAGLIGARNVSDAGSSYLNSHLLVSILLTAIAATLIAGGILMAAKKIGFHINYLAAVLLIYLPAIACLGWAINVYFKNIVSIS